jgi:hypothetical protein
MSIKKFFTILILALILSGALSASEVRMYSGMWNDRDGSNGSLIIIFTQLEGKTWFAKFEGTWDRGRFSYDVDMTAIKRGKKTRVMGIAFIEGRSYRWSGYFNEKVFVGRYSSDRNEGDFRLRRTRSENKK